MTNERETESATATAEAPDNQTPTARKRTARKKTAARKTASKKAAKKASRRTKAAAANESQQDLPLNEDAPSRPAAPKAPEKPQEEDVPTHFSTDSDAREDTPKDRDSEPSRDEGRSGKPRSKSDENESGDDSGTSDAAGRQQGSRSRDRNRSGGDSQSNRDSAGEQSQDDRSEQSGRGRNRSSGNDNRNQGGQSRGGGGQGGNQGGGNRSGGGGGGRQNNNKKKRKKSNKGGRGPNEPKAPYKQPEEPEYEPIMGDLADWEFFDDSDAMAEVLEEISGGEPVSVDELMQLSLMQLIQEAEKLGIEVKHTPNRYELLDVIFDVATEQRRPLLAEGIFEEAEDGFGLLLYSCDSYKYRPFNAFIPESLVRDYGLKTGHRVKAQVHPHRDGETVPFALKILEVMGKPAEELEKLDPFEELIPFYPTRRLLLETDPDVKWDNFSMRIVDILTPIGLGQRGLIVAPPRTGKTVLMQGIANAVAVNNPEAHLIVLLVDERPEEVTDFRRQVKGEVVASTFDESPHSHVHCAEIVIEKARRLVEHGGDVIILLDSVTRLARAYNALMPNSGKILSGGVEANALQKPKRFFGSARNIEGGGSLTIIGTALVETGSRMDEVIFEEFKGTGNSEIHLDRQLVDKRIFPSINFEKSGTRKEELLYHPDELGKVYGLRRAMKGVPGTEAMEMLIQRVKRTKTNVEFLMSINR